VCRALSRYFDRDGAVERRASVTVEEVVTVEGAERIVACCVAVRGVMVEEVLATCEMVDSHGLGFVHQTSCRRGPCQLGPYPAACRYLVGDDSSGQGALRYVAGPLERGPCCFVARTGGGRPEAPSAGSASVASAQAYRTG